MIVRTLEKGVERFMESGYAGKLLRVNLTTRKIFEEKYVDALSVADNVVMTPLFAKEKVPENERLSVEKVREGLTQKGIPAWITTADDNMLDYVEVLNPGNKLTIRLRWGYTYRNVTLRARITMPDLYELEFSGGTQGTVEDFTSSHEFEVDLSGGSSLIGDDFANAALCFIFRHSDVLM